MSNITLSDLRADLPLTKRAAYLQTGSHGPTPDSILRVLSEEMEFDCHHGIGDAKAKDALNTREIQARSKLATLLSVNPKELAITPNTSNAMQSVLRSFNWANGDEIIISSLEHISTVAACQALEQRYGVTTKVIEADQNDGIFLESLKTSLNERVKLVCISQVASPDGRVLPVTESSRLAHDKGLPIVVDGAQSVGQFEVDVSALECDYFVGSGHKWLLGPMGIGYLWTSPTQMEDFRPVLKPDYSPWKLPEEIAPPITAQYRSEIGTYNQALVVALGHAVDNIVDIGLDVITNHVNHLSKILREQISGIKGVKSITPIETYASAGITTLKFDGFDHNDMKLLVDALEAEHQVLVKNQWLTAPSQPGKVGMRISVAAFNTEDEISQLLDGLKKELQRL